MTLMIPSFSFADSSDYLLPVFDSKPTYNDMSGCPYVVYSGKNYYYGSTINSSYIFAYTDTSDNTYPLKAVVCSNQSFTYYQGAGGNKVVYTENANTNNNGVYYTVAQNASSATFSFENIGSFSSTADAVNYFYNIINTPSTKYPFTIQNGYLFVYDLGSSGTMYSFDLSSTSEEYSDISSDPFPDTNQSYWFSNSLPEIDETTIPASGAVTITWQKGGNTNIFGQTQSMVSTISGTSTGRYLYIYNPPVHYKWSGSSNPTASETVNYPMVINGVSDLDNFYVYDSVARLVDFNQGGLVAGTVTGEPGIGTVSGGSISVTTSDGSIYVQTSGGSTDISGANGGSLAENISGLQQTLDNFVSQFVKLLSAPISHIQQLISSGSNFFEVMTGLFDWLPSEVSGVIVSALVVMVVIGVIKMLL